VPGSAKKPGPDMNLTWPSTIEENQNKKQKKVVRPGGHSTLHTPRFKNWLKNSKLSLIPMKNKSALEKFSDQQPYGYKVEMIVQNNLLGQIHRGRITKVNGDLPSIG
jgi:hypothetical protein